MLRCKVKAIPGIALMEPETKGAIAFAGKSKAYETKWEARALLYLHSTGLDSDE